MRVLLDTNFILTCIKQRIGFDSLANNLFDESIEWIVPHDVLNELKNLKDKKGIKVKDKKSAELSLKILQIIKPKIVQLSGKNPNVDMKIVNYIKGKNIILATLDKNLKSRVNNKILTIRGKNSIKLV